MVAANCVVISSAHEDQGTDQSEILLAGVSHRRKRLATARVHRVAQEGFAEVVGGVAEGDDVGIQTTHDFINCATAIAATFVAAVLRFGVEQAV